MDAGENPNPQIWILKKNGCDLAIMTVSLKGAIRRSGICEIIPTELGFPHPGIIPKANPGRHGIAIIETPSIHRPGQNSELPSRNTGCDTMRV
jgi:hypothetical protein